MASYRIEVQQVNDPEGWLFWAAYRNEQHALLDYEGLRLNPNMLKVRCLCDGELRYWDFCSGSNSDSRPPAAPRIPRK